MRYLFLAILCIIIYAIFPVIGFSQPIRYGVESENSKEKKPTIKSTIVSQFRYFPQTSGLRVLPSSGATSATILRSPSIIAKEKYTSNLNKAANLAKNGLFEKAIPIYKSILKEDNNLIEAHLGLGHVLLQTEAFQEAILEFDEVLKKDPSNIEAQLNHAVILYCMGKIDQAIEEYKNIKTNKNSYLSAINFNLALAYYFQGNFEESEKSYLSAIKQKDVYPEAYNNLGLLYQLDGKEDKAIENFRIAIKQRFDYYLAHYNLSGLLSEKSEFEQAISEAKIAIKQNPNFPEAYLNLGTIYLAKVLLKNSEDLDSKDLDKAIAAYKKAIELKTGDYSFAHENLAIALTLNKQFDEAFCEYRIAINQYSEIPEETIQNLLSSITGQQTFAIATELNRFDDKKKSKIKQEKQFNFLENAFEQYQNLDEELKNNVDIRYSLGISYKKANKLQEACYELREALKLSNNLDLEVKKAFEDLCNN